MNRPLLLLFGSALLTGAVAGLAFAKLTNAAMMATLRRQLWAHILGLHLFGDEPAAAFDCLRAVVRTNGLLLWRVLPALAVAAPLVALTVWQISPFLRDTPLNHGDAAVLTVRFNKPLDQIPDPRLPLPQGLVADAPPVHVPSSQEIAWRLRPTSPHTDSKMPAVWTRTMPFARSATISSFAMQFSWFGISMEWGYWFGAAASLAALVCAKLVRLCN